MFSDHSVQVDPDESLTRIRTPMTQQPILKMFFTQRTLEERIVAEIDHPHRQVVARLPEGVRFSEFVRAQRRTRDRGPCGTEGTDRRGCLAHGVARAAGTMIASCIPSTG